MGYGVIFRVWGDYACFTRPELKVEKVSYDMMTASAAKGILESVYWKPAIRWIIDEIHVINEIRFTNVRRNEVSEVLKLSQVKGAMNRNAPLYIDAPGKRHQRASMILTDVEYIIKAHFELNLDKCGETDTKEKHYNIAVRRLKKGQYFSAPFLGTREFGANFELIENEKDIPKSKLEGEKDLGYMLYDLNYKLSDDKKRREVSPKYIRAVLNNGILDLKNIRDEVVE